MCIMQRLLVCTFLITLIGSAGGTITTKRTCEHDRMELSCPNTQVIKVRSAFYGRTQDATVCPHWNINDFNCSFPSAPAKIRETCDGHNHCDFQVVNWYFGGVDPCGTTHKYAEVVYECQLPDPLRNVFACEHQYLDFSCPAGEVIRVVSAFYGRHEGASKCPHTDINDLQCDFPRADDTIKLTCEFLNSCRFPVYNFFFDGIDPCATTHKYVSVDYLCEVIQQVDHPVPGGPRIQTCEGEKFAVTCPVGESLDILRSNYGRLDGANTCPHPDIHNVNCSLPLAERLIWNQCQFRNSCEFMVDVTYFMDDPCRDTFKYVEVDYICKSHDQLPIPDGATRHVACENTYSIISCEEGEIISVVRADYGRSDGGGTCPHPYIKTIDCHLPGATTKVQRRCNGRNSCIFPVTNFWFENDPCSSTHKYATVDYRCVPVV